MPVSHSLLVAGIGRVTMPANGPWTLGSNGTGSPEIRDASDKRTDIDVTFPNGKLGHNVSFAKHADVMKIITAFNVALAEEKLAAAEAKHNA